MTSRQLKFVLAAAASLLPVTAALADPPSWPGVQPREWQQTNPVHAHPTDFKYPQQGPGGVWFVTICAGGAGVSGLRLPPPGKGLSNPQVTNDPNGGANPHADWSTSHAGTDGSVDINGHGVGENDLQVSYTTPGGGTSTYKLHVRVIDCSQPVARGGSRGGIHADPRPREDSESGGLFDHITIGVGIGIGGGHHDHDDRGHDDRNRHDRDDTVRPTGDDTRPHD